MSEKKEEEKEIEKEVEEEEVPSEFFDAEIGDLSERIKEIFAEIFDRFDIDKDGALDDVELDNFVLKCSGRVFSQEEKNDILENFDINDKKQLKKSGFIQMYSLQTMSEPEETWKDLQSLGYSLSDDKIILKI